MKKFKFLPVVLGVLFVSIMASCTKEGVYNPSKKIQRLYHASSGYYEVDKYLAESWNWSGKTLQSIDHFYSDGSTRYTENFSYENNRLTRVDVYKYSEYITFDYDGRHLKIANLYDHNKLYATIAYTYESNKVKQMTITYFDSKKGESTLMNSMMPVCTKTAEVMTKFAEENATRGMDIITYQFTWTNDNITKVVGTLEGSMITITLSYDEKKSPLKGFLNIAGVDEDNPGTTFYSKNNIVQMMYTNIQNDNIILNYTYQYDSDNYPTLAIESEVDSEYTYSTFYEYDK